MRALQFTRLILENYGIYGGTTDIDLRPEPDKPVILFGGRNGAGKTTLFESLLVCLYGVSCLRMMRTAAAAAASGAGGGGGAGGRREYERLLASRVHRGRGGKTAAGSASITVRFAAFIGGGEGAEYEVRRSWRAAASGDDGGRAAKGKIRETLAVGRRPADAASGAPFEPVDMESRWQSFIMDLAPPATAGLFFFDGERVSKIARQYGGYAGEAFKSALGLDIVEKLQSDLLANGARESVEGADGGKDGGPPAKYDELEAERAGHDLERRRLSEMLDQKSAELAELRSEVAAAEQKVEAFRDGGGGGGGSSEGGEPGPDARLDRSILEREDAERRILEICESCEAPLRLLPDRLASDVMGWLDGHWDAQVRKFAAESADAVVSTIRECVESDNTMSAAFKDRMTRILDKVESVRKERRGEMREGKGGEPPITPLPPTVSALLALRTLKAVRRRKKDDSLRELCSGLAALRTRITELESARSIRERGESECREAVRELTALASRAGTMSADARRLEADMRAHAAAARAANSKMRDVLKLARKRGGSTRKAELRASVQDALESFRSRMQAARTRRLEDSLLQNMRILMHKDAVERVEVDAENGFAIRLYGAVADNVGGEGGANDADEPSTDPAACLSEGERQMFAVSVIWALAQTSGRPLPFVVDTPLARLDVAHRSSMTREFLPGCSHQCIVLSTDSEIDRERLAELWPRVAKSYTLEYDEAEGRATCRPGYFWNDDDSDDDVHNGIGGSVDGA